jgi:hypothetical protein
MFAEPGREFAELAARTSPEARVRVLAHGETLALGPAA